MGTLSGLVYDGAGLTERERAVYKMKASGHSLRDIGRVLGVSFETVRKDFAKARDYVNRLEHVDVTSKIDLALERLDLATAAIMPKVRAGNLGAISQLCVLEKRRAELLGLDSIGNADLMWKDGGSVTSRGNEAARRLTAEEAVKKAAEMADRLVNPLDNSRTAGEYLQTRRPNPSHSSAR